MTQHRSLARAALASLAVGVMAVATACSGNSGSDSASSTPSSSGSSSISLPQDVKDRGYITVAEEQDYPPFSYSQDGNLVGVDADVRAALSKVLGIEVQPQVLAFDSWIPSLQAKRVDVLGEVLNDLPDRRKVADFVDFMNSGDSLITKAGSSVTASSLDDLCGLAVGTVLGANTTPVVLQQQKDCEASGAASLDAKVYNDQPAGLLAVETGRIDAFLIPSLSGGYVVSQANGVLEIGPVIDEAVPGGWAVAKDSPLGPALVAAFGKLYQSGELKTIYDKYGIGQFLVEPQLNAAG